MSDRPSITSRELDELRRAHDQVREQAARLGLDPGEVEFHVVPAHLLYEVASYGVPGHFSHWSYGRDFWRQKASYDRGHSRLYELVINSDPAQAFLLDTNSVLENTFVMAHVAGHADCFRRNRYFAHTNRHMPESARAAADRIRRYEAQHGRHVVEAFIDHAMTINGHVENPMVQAEAPLPDQMPEDQPSPYDDLFELSDTGDAVAWRRRAKRNPQHPTGDLLGFISRFGDLDDWQRDILTILREESLYFWPQRQTKVLNEGFASIVHHKIMHALDPAADPGGVAFAHMHASVLSPHLGSLNPYLVGFEILRRIEERWDNPGDDDRSRFGLVGGEGWARVLEAVEFENDVSLVRNYLDKHVVDKLDLFTFFRDEKAKAYKVRSTARGTLLSDAEGWEAVRDALVEQLAGAGLVDIKVVDGDWRGRGELLLRHEDDKALDRKCAVKVLHSIRVLWGRPVFLLTRTAEGRWDRLGYDDADTVVEDVPTSEAE